MRISSSVSLSLVFLCSPCRALVISDEEQWSSSNRRFGVCAKSKSLASLVLKANLAARWQVPGLHSLDLRRGFDLQPLGLRYGIDDAKNKSKKSSEVYALIKKDFVFFERLTTFLLRMTSGVWASIPRFMSRVTRFPARVMVVDLSGVIIAENDLRLTSQYQTGQPELLYSDSAMMEPPSARGTPGIINLARIDALLKKAFETSGLRAVVLLINSPGGSPAQSSLIYQRLRTLRKQHKNVLLLAFVEDAAVSGGYYIASAADEIIADPSSLVGSIGVISRGFGYVGMIKKRGVTRRVRTAGKHKGGSDPYLRERRSDLDMERRLLEELHRNFIAAVKKGRGNRLKPEKAAELHWRTTVSKHGFFAAPSKRQLAKLVSEGAGLFDGSVYSGEVGLELGLVDAVGEMRTELQNRFGRHVSIETVQPKDKMDDLTRLLRWLV